MKAPQPALTTATVVALALALLIGRNIMPKENEMGSIPQAVVHSTDMAAMPQVAVPNARIGSEFERREDHSQDFSQQRAFPLGSRVPSAPNDAPQNDFTEEEFLAALDQDLEPWERTPVEIGGALGPQKSVVLSAKHRPVTTKKDAMPDSLTEEDFFASLGEDFHHVEKTPVEIGGPLGVQKSAVLIAKHALASMQKDAVQDSLKEADFFAALDQDLDTMEKTAVEIGGPLGPQKSAVLIAKHTPASMQKDSVQDSLMEEDFFAALDQDLDPVEKTSVEIGGTLGPQKSAVLMAKRRPASLQKNAVQESLKEEDFFAALDQDLETVERTPVEIGGPLGPRKATVLSAKHRLASTQKDAMQDSLTEEDFFAALDKDIDPVEKIPLEIGGPLGPQKSAVLIAKHRPAALLKDAVQDSLTEADFFAALDQDTDPVEKTHVEIGSPLGPQKSAVLMAKQRPASKQRDAVQDALTEDDFFAALDQHLDPMERTPVEIGGPLGPQKSEVLIAKKRLASGN